ncbi:MAG: hypothetical protein NZ928_04635 [Endomicrobia bacterium]|nr:hypothetical protein [Endomicrobiia bacterium]
MKVSRLIVSIFVSLIIFNIHLSAFNFLINIIYGILPQPIRSAFKGEGLQIDQFEYGFGNCNFSSLGYLQSEIDHREGTLITEEEGKFKFSVPTYYLYGGYIAHVSTPILTVIYPGWQLETELGYGGVAYSVRLREKNQQFFVTGTSGFNWRVFKSNKITANLLTGYKLHYLLKELLYYGIQIGNSITKKFSLSFEYYTTYRGGNFFIFFGEPTRTVSKETHYLLSSNFILSKKYLLKASVMYKQWYKKEFRQPEVEEKLNLYGIVLALISK